MTKLIIFENKHDNEPQSNTITLGTQRDFSEIRLKNFESVKTEFRWLSSNSIIILLVLD